MQTINSIITMALLAIALTACGEKTQTEEWYTAHPEEMKKESEKCRLKSFEAMIKDKHCQVIEKARQKAINKQERNAPIPNIKFK